MSEILLVDDNSLFRLGLREVIRSAQPDISVLESESLLGARAILREKTGIVLVILDIKVRDCGGFVGLFELHREFANTPVIVCSANLDSDSISRAVAFGAAGYISKSASRDVIAQMLKTGSWTTGPIIASESQVDPIAALSPAQRRVLQGLKRGLRNKQIALELGLTEKTVKAYTNLLYRRLGVGGRAEALILLQKVSLEPGVPAAATELAGIVSPPL
jgi:DNA-binding NarL/FixJ family response regulator